MGIVRKQSFLSSLFIYIGFGIGALNMVLFPRFFSQEAFGLTRAMFEFSNLFSVVATLGAVNTFVKFFPFYEGHLKPEKNDLPFLATLSCLLGCILFVAAAFIFKGWMVRKFGHSPLFISHYNLVIPFTVSYTAFLLLESFAWMAHKTVTSNFLRETMYRIMVSLLIVLYLLHIIKLETFFILFAFIYFPAVFILLGVLSGDGTIKFCTRISRVTHRLYRKMLVFTLYHFSGVIINILPKTLDSIMILGISANGLSDVAIYSIPIYIVTVMEVPQRGMLGIASALISEAWRNNNMAKIKELYQKTSLNLLLVGIGLFGLLYPNMDNVVRFLGKNYALAKEIVLIAGVAKLVDLGMGMNQQILSLSRHWKVDFYTSAFFVFLTVPLNYYFISHYGVIGAAYGNAIGLVSYNLLRLGYLWYLFRLQPFMYKTLYIIGIGAIAVTITLLMPYLGNLILDLAVRSLLFSLLFVPAIIYFNISPDFTDMYRTFVRRLKWK